MIENICFSVSARRFVCGIAHSGAMLLRVIPSSVALDLADVAEQYPFSARPERYGERGVFQNFSACEEEDVPTESPLRVLSERIAGTVLEAFAKDKVSSPFDSLLFFNDHLLLRYPAADVGLGVHCDHSKYRNLIVSLTLRGIAVFNVHETPDTLPTVSFDVLPGMAVFMRAPGFLGEKVRPYHSLTSVAEERVALVLKQKRKEL